MWPFKKSPEKKQAAPAPTARPVENPVLETAMFRHRFQPSEMTVRDVGRAFQSATYLAPIKGDRLKLTQNGESTLIEPGSVIEFMTVQNTEGNTYLPVFTSWSELRHWAGDDAQAFVQKPSEVWYRALHGTPPMGVVINPANMPWTLEPANIKSLTEEFGEQSK